jgi:hypothetical protein
MGNGRNMIKLYLRQEFSFDVIEIVSRKEGSGGCIDIEYKVYGGDIKETTISPTVFTKWVLDRNIPREMSEFVIEKWVDHTSNT